MSTFDPAASRERPGRLSLADSSSSAHPSSDRFPAERPRVLIVDDNDPVLRLHARALATAGFDVETATSGNAAIQALGGTAFDVILSDIDMPGMDGIALLDQVRLRDVDVPVILITGAPSMESAVKALDRGALRYLTKPTNLSELVKVSSDAVRLHRIAVAKRQAFSVLNGSGPFAGDQAGLSVSLDRMLATMHIAYQPIVSWSARAVVAYEALLRSIEPSLPGPAAVLDAAERLTRVHDLGRRVRELAIQPIRDLPADVRLFLNLHPLDLLDETLLDRDSPLAALAGRLTLEVTERTSLDRLRDVRPRITSIRELGFRFALDDFGAGFGGLNSFAVLQPEVVKIDMGLVRGIEREPTKQTLVKTMTRMCGELDIAVIAEGVETADERDELVRAGCDLMQGFLFAKPAPHFPTAEF